MVNSVMNTLVYVKCMHYIVLTSDIVYLFENSGTFRSNHYYASNAAVSSMQSN